MNKEVSRSIGWVNPPTPRARSKKLRFASKTMHCPCGENRDKITEIDDFFRFIA
jgi:hypothetical protein